MVPGPPTTLGTAPLAVPRLVRSSAADDELQLLFSGLDAAREAAAEAWERRKSLALDDAGSSGGAGHRGHSLGGYQSDHA